MHKELPRLGSGVPGLDRVLCGGFIEGSSYIIQGKPGAGKTVLANQIAFAQAAQGRRILYVTLLAESHDRLFHALSTMDYYDGSRLGNGISYVSVFQTLRDSGLNAVVSLLRQEIARQSATMLVIDGLLNARDRADTNLDVKTFVAELQGHAAFAGCTVLFLASIGTDDTNPEHTMVDGVIDLSETSFGVRTIRRLQVRKSRGSAALNGYHQFRITSAGFSVFPRIEAEFARPSRMDMAPTETIPTGIQGMDAVSGGGISRGTVSVVMGPSGAGKTSFGMSFLQECSPAEPGLMFGFYETPAWLEMRARSIGIDLPGLVESGAVEICWQPMTENLVDELGHRLLEHVKQRGVKRLFIDGLGGFGRANEYPARLVEFFAALTNELRALGVTTLASWEMPEIVGTHVSSLAPEFTSIIDNLFMVRQIGFGPELRRVFAIMKLRDKMFEPVVHNVRIDGRGMVIGGVFEGADSASAVVSTTPRSA